MKKIVLCFFVFCSIPLIAQDWPIYKGNIYFTGNNDELIVKNANLKWLFQADSRTYNPIVSDGKVYFVDHNADLYCVNEEYGKLLWRVDFQKISAQFKAASRSAGKVKYPLIQGNTLFLSDPIAIYALNKQNGSVLWARTGMRQETLPPAASGLSGIAPRPMVDGIYSDPVLFDGKIFYGTREMFLSRETQNGHDLWSNNDIKTFSAYPSFYDNSIITQSMDFTKNEFRVYRLDSATGKEVWSKQIPKPERIFPAVIYNKKVIIPSSTSIYCLDYETGSLVWNKDYGRYITSNPSFTDRSVIVSVDNSDIAVINPETGAVEKTVVLGKASSPYFVTVRDILYCASNVTKMVSGKEVTYGTVKAVTFDDAVQWEFTAPFPGPVSQPVASGGILFLPAGNYLYAIGTEYYAKVVQGGEGYAVVDGGGSDTGGLDKKIADLDPNKDSSVTPLKNENETPKPPAIELRPIKLAVTNPSGNPMQAQIEIRKWDKDKLIYSETKIIDKESEIMIPSGDGVEITASARNYIPKKKIIQGTETQTSISLDPIETGRVYTVDNINFQFDKAYLLPDSINLLDRVLRIMQENPSMKLEIRGHTDNIGDAAYNMKLSQRRADAVAEYMIKHGISPERLIAKGFGETKAIAPNDTNVNRAKNRRTEFVFTK